MFNSFINIKTVKHILTYIALLSKNKQLHTFIKGPSIKSYQI